METVLQAVYDMVEQAAQQGCVWTQAGSPHVVSLQPKRKAFRKASQSLQACKQFRDAVSRWYL